MKYTLLLLEMRQRENKKNDLPKVIELRGWYSQDSTLGNLAQEVAFRKPLSSTSSQDASEPGETVHFHSQRPSLLNSEGSCVKGPLSLTQFPSYTKTLKP